MKVLKCRNINTLKHSSQNIQTEITQLSLRHYGQSVKIGVGEQGHRFDPTGIRHYKTLTRFIPLVFFYTPLETSENF